MPEGDFILLLKEINFNDAAQEYQFFQEVPSENGYINPFYQMDYAAFIACGIPECMDYAQGKNLPEGYVPATRFFLWNDDKIVGVFHLRHYLNEALYHGSGHIGYAIHPNYRGQGYATKGLALALKEIVKLPGFTGSEVFLHCNKTNPASLRIMLNNGGYIHHQDDEGYYVRIKI